MTARDVEGILRRYGFELVSQRGSHRKWRHPERGLQVIVADHRGRDLPIGTLRGIFAQAEVPEHEWKR